VEPRMVKIGKYYINLSNLSFAEVGSTRLEPGKRWIDLTFNSDDAEMRLIDEDAEKIIAFLTLNSQEL
jgi:hypothetical protein